ncbi:MAG: hypothetical protein ACRDZ4_08425 [Egibacteraceae bacterium]
MANVGVVIDGAVLHALRKHRMWSMAKLAREARRFAKRVNENSALAPATVCRAENAEHPRLTEDNLRYLVGALEPSQAELRRLLRDAELPEALLRLCSDAPGRQPAEQDPATLAATVAQLNAAVAEMRALIHPPSLGAATARQADDVDRFKFLHEFLPGVLGAAVVPWAAVERLSDTRHTGVDDTLVAASEDMADVLWRACSSASTERHQRLLVAVGREAGAVREILRRPMTDDQRRRLYEVSVGLHAEAGWLGLRLHELDVADGFFALARAAAHDSADDRLQAQALQISTHPLSSLQHGGHGGDDDLALTRVKQAAVHAANADAHTRAETARRLAEQSALDRDDPGFRAALEQAYEEFARIDGSETGFTVRLGLLSPRWLHASAGWGHMLAKRNSEALREFRAAVRDPAMAPGGAVQLHADMARVWVQLDEPEQACAELTAALKLATAIGYPMGMQRIRGVRAGFPTPWAELDCVRQLDERLRTAATAA